MRSLVLLAMLMTAPPPAIIADSGGGEGPAWDRPDSDPPQPGIILARNHVGNGTQKDRLDANITTDPACRGIDPTDRQAKFDCLIGRYRPNRPPDPPGPSN